MLRQTIQGVALKPELLQATQMAKLWQYIKMLGCKASTYVFQITSEELFENKIK
jgi:hypothetical protein